jgi:glycosyltransferase involved in cell wall biosynthesis
MTERDSISVVVACRNENPHILNLLKNLRQINWDARPYEVLIADGMSTDGTRRVLDEFAQRHPWCSIVDNPGQIASAGLNRAIRQARGEFIIRMDAHTSYEPDYVVRCIEVLEGSGAWNVGGPQRSQATGYMQRAIQAGYHSPFASGGARFRDDRYRGPADTVPYGCWRRRILLQVGLFDETLVRNQDDELNLRLRLAGGGIWQDPSIVSWYTPRASLRALFRQYAQFGFWRIAVLRKHPATAALRQYIPGAAAMGAFLLIALTLLGALSGNRMLLGGSGFVLTGLAAIYLALSAIASLQAAARYGWDLLPILPITFALYQSGYATGFLIGLVYWGLCSQRQRPIPRVFTALTR